MLFYQQLNYILFIDNQVLYHFRLHQMYLVHSTYSLKKNVNSGMISMMHLYNHNMYIF